VWIYEPPEPKELKDQTVEAKQYVVKYDDGPRDAESTVVHAKTGRVYSIGKQEEDGGHLYEDRPRCPRRGPMSSRVPRRSACGPRTRRSPRTGSS
jgi:hypothetical protein